MTAFFARVHAGRGEQDRQEAIDRLVDTIEDPSAMRSDLEALEDILRLALALLTRETPAQ